MRFVRLTGFLGATVAALSLLAATPQAGAQSEFEIAANSKRTRAAPIRSGGTHVYLLRGWLDIFSTGMDDLTVKLNRRGIRATVHGHAEYMALADRIASQYRSGVRERVVIIGHSLGANAAIEMAARLNEHKIPVPLIITYDPTAVMQAPPNVSRVINFYQSNNGWGTRVAPGRGFHGSISNIDLAREPDLGHTGIDKSSRLHAQSISYIQSIGGGRSRSAEPADAPQAPKPSAGEKQKDSDTPAPGAEDRSNRRQAASRAPAPPDTF